MRRHLTATMLLAATLLPAGCHGTPTPPTPTTCDWQTPLTMDGRHRALVEREYLTRCDDV